MREIGRTAVNMTGTIQGVDLVRTAQPPRTNSIREQLEQLDPAALDLDDILEEGLTDGQ